MRSTIAIALLGAANAQFTILDSTDNECWFNEGAEWLGTCTSLFYWYCDEYEIEAGESCNVSTFSDTQIQWEWEEVVVSTMAYGTDGGWGRIDELNENDSSSNFNSFMRDISVWTEGALQSLIYKSDNIPDNDHKWYSSWADPFSEGCYELQSTPVKYDQETLPKLNRMSGMCGFRLTFTNNNEFRSLPVKVLRDSATTLVTSAIAIAATTAALF